MPQEELPAVDVVAAEGQVAPGDINIRLANMSKKIKLIQERVAKAVAEMATEVSSVRGLVSDARLRRFLTSECAVDPSELRTYFGYTSAVGDHSRRVQETRTSFSAIKALVAAPAETRVRALDAMAHGNTVAAKDVAAIKREIAKRDADPQKVFERQRTYALKKASESLAGNKLEAFRAKASSFGADLVSFYNLGFEEKPVWEETLRSMRDDLQKKAAVLLKSFCETFDVKSLPQPWLYDYHGTPNDSVHLARAHDALKQLAAGVFQQWDEMYHVPYDTSHDFLDRWAVESVLWLTDDLELPERTSPAGARDEILCYEPPQRLTSLEICAGGGGQAIGLHAAGFDALGLYEFKPDAVATLEANWPLGPVHLADVRDVDFTKYKGKVDLVAGGVPCQPFSSLGLKAGRDDERDLFLEAVRLVREIEPRAFFFENVSNFGKAGATAYRAELHDLFRDLGYETKLISLNGHDYGLGVSRPRVAFVGFRDGMLAGFKVPPPLQKPSERTTLGEALYDIVAKNGWSGARAWADQANEVGPTIVGGSESSGKYSSGHQEKDWNRLDVDISRIGRDSPAPDHVGMVQLTNEMGAHLQGFPSDWEFQGSMTSIKRQVANAFPPVMSRAIGLSIFSALTGVKFDFGHALRRELLGKRPGKLATIKVRRRGAVEELEDA